MSPSLLLALFACGAPATAPMHRGASGARLAVDYLGDTDVVGFHFEIVRVACDSGDSFEPFSLQANVDLEDFLFPGEVDFLGQTLDPDASHVGSDLFVSLEPGCYDLLATPASSLDVDDPDSWTPSEDCATARAQGIEVADGQTTDVTLISQCVGDEVGALDALAVLNHPPVLSTTVQDKFALECEPVEVCVTAIDPDDDPIEIVLDPRVPSGEWLRESGPLQLVGWEAGVRIWEQCFTVVPHAAADYTYLVYAYDLLADSSRIEDVVAPEISHDELSFPIYTSPAAVSAPYCHHDGQLVQLGDIVLDEECAQDLLDPQSYWCGGGDGDDSNDVFLCDEDGELIVEAAYPPCDLTEVTLTIGVDNAVYVWLDGAPVDTLTGAAWADVQSETFQLPAGEHTIAIYVENWEPGGSSNRGYLAGRLEIDGVVAHLTGDGSWRENPSPYTALIGTPWSSPPNVLWGPAPADGVTGLYGVPAGWISPGFDDSAWPSDVTCLNQAFTMFSAPYLDLVNAGAELVWQAGSCNSEGTGAFRLTFTL
jgi:hypothetical protein